VDSSDHFVIDPEPIIGCPHGRAQRHKRPESPRGPLGAANVDGGSAHHQQHESELKQIGHRREGGTLQSGGAGKLNGNQRNQGGEPGMSGCELGTG